MTIAGTFPAQGMRVALDLAAHDGPRARYVGAAFTPSARFEIDLAIDVATGAATLAIGATTPRDAEGSSVAAALDPPSAAALDPADQAFIRQLGHQLWRQATQTPADRGGGTWARRVQRWRGPK